MGFYNTTRLRPGCYRGVGLFLFFKKSLSQLWVSVIIPDIYNGRIDVTVVGLAGNWLFNSLVLDPPAVNHM